MRAPAAKVKGQPQANYSPKKLLVSIKELKTSPRLNVQIQVRETVVWKERENEVVGEKAKVEERLERDLDPQVKQFPLAAKLRRFLGDILNKQQAQAD